MDNISNHAFNYPVLILNKGLLPDHDDVSLARYLFSALTLAVSRITQNEEMIVGFHLHPQEIACWKDDECLRQHILPLNIRLNSATPIAGFTREIMAWMTPDAIHQKNTVGVSVLTLGSQHALHDVFDLEISWQPPVENQPVRSLTCHVASREEAFVLTLRFNPARFSATQMQNCLRYGAR